MHDLIWKMVRDREGQKGDPADGTYACSDVREDQDQNFETPARLINHMELSVQLVVACREASAPMSVELQEWGSKEFVKSVPGYYFSSPAVNEIEGSDPRLYL